MSLLKSFSSSIYSDFIRLSDVLKNQPSNTISFCFNIKRTWSSVLQHLFLSSWSHVWLETSVTLPQDLKLLLSKLSWGTYNLLYLSFQGVSALPLRTDCTLREERQSIEWQSWILKEYEAALAESSNGHFPVDW